MSTYIVVITFRRMHPGIKTRPTRIPQDFADDALIQRASDFRSKTRCSRLPAHIRAFIVRKDPRASVSDQATAGRLIQQLLEYCKSHWRVYVDTILKRTRSHGFPSKCLSCGDITRWDASSGLRVGLVDQQDHQYCKRFTHSLLPSTKAMLKLPTINNAWIKVRKCYDPDDDTTFQQRPESKQLALDLGYVSVVQTTAVSSEPDQCVSNNPAGWHCFACDKSAIAQPLTLMNCEGCGAPREQW